MQADITIEYENWKQCAFDAQSSATNVIAIIEKKDIIPEYIGNVSIVLTDDKHIQKLNKEFRHKDKPTNVLSFPQLTDDIAPASSPDIAMESSLGDIIISLDTIKREAEEQNITLESHYNHMIIHGFLHLLGHDHNDDEEADRMETLEIEILSELGIKNPYSETETMA